MYKIEKNIPKPTVLMEFPFDKMEVGDSFLVPAKNEKNINALRTSINNRVATYNRMIHPKIIKISVRKDGLGVRVWRIE